MFTLAKNRDEKGMELRDVMVDAIELAMADDERVVALEADLGGASRFTNIAKKYPGRLIQCGIAEANMIGVAAGMSSEGYHPFTHTFGPFSTRRVFDQIFLSGAYAHNTLNIFGSDPGFAVGINGGTHTTWEDMALMRTIPGAIVCDPADETQMRWIVAEYAKMEGIHYIRANRKNVRNVYEPGSTFEFGKGNLLRQGSDVLIVACGQLVSEALDAAEALEAEGVSCSVVDMFCVKPLDEELVLSEAAGKKLVVTFENHGVIGGLGDAVAATLAEAGAGVKLVRHGVKERFGQVGDPAWLQKDFHLTADNLVASVKGGLA